MKYIIFFLAVLGMFPLAYIASMNKIILRGVAFSIVFFTLLFESTAINFCSHEIYRGTSRGIEIALVHLISFALLLAFVLKHKKISFVPDKGAIFYLLYFLSGIISMVNADNYLFSFFEIWKMLLVYLMFLAIWNYITITGDFKIFLIAMGSFIVCNFVIIVKEKYLDGVFQANGVFPHQNGMAMYMSVLGCIFFAAYYNLTTRKEWLIYGSLFAITSASLVLTYSRGAILCYPIGLFVSWMLSLCYKFKVRNLPKLLPLVLAGILAIILFAPRVMERFEKAPEASANTRIDLAIAGLNMMNDKFFGVGINNWGIKINPPYEYSEHRDKGHGMDEDYKDGLVETIYILVGAECGYYALLLLLLFMGYYLFYAFKLSSKLRDTPYFFFVAGLAGSLMAVYLQSFLERGIFKGSINLAQMMTLFAMTSSLIWAQKQKKLEKR